MLQRYMEPSFITASSRPSTETELQQQAELTIKAGQLYEF